MDMGELRGYTRPSTTQQPRTVVILSSDGINDSPRPWLLGIELRERDPGDLLRSASLSDPSGVAPLKMGAPS